MAKTLAPVKPVTAVGYLLAATVVACLVNIGIAALAHAAGASEDFEPLTIGAYVTYTVVGIIAGTIGWALVRQRAENPRAVLRWLVPTVVVISFIPDVAMFFVPDFQPNANAVGIIALLVMHVVVAVCAVAALVRALPIDRQPA
ncbi:DUF6069 domain-containing protein [Kibdelosporangium persicum]|uniref:Secreted protein with PEP-CTERM sorting signal n=1 Tax=Kibdelosporangium persicum TaxID=2698649 RepID=A0ABX2F6N4_9PSEU|nr:DUF6069 family protein [Kibdelosporangium persicum]NRN67011.1 putative secreted protein with PEP-CTERM sorting signal [Kibdelosporangium persicum]